MSALPFPRRKPTGAKISRRRTFYHSGNLGDVIYALYAIRLAGGGSLIIGPEQAGTKDCGNPIIREQYERFLPLLRHQGHLLETSFSENYPKGCEDLNRFRDLWFDDALRARMKIDNLCQMACHLLGVVDRFKPGEPWLTVPTTEPSGKIVVARSFSYLPEVWGLKSLPWAELVERYGKLMMFVGWEHEWTHFCSQFGQVDYHPVADFLELASVIKAARVFIGNESFPCAIALASGQRVLQECNPIRPDAKFGPVTFRSARFLNQFDDPKRFEAWLTP